MNLPLRTLTILSIHEPSTLFIYRPSSLLRNLHQYSLTILSVQETSHFMDQSLYAWTILSTHRPSYTYAYPIHSYHIYIHHNLCAWNTYIWIFSPCRVYAIFMYHSRNTWTILSNHEASETILWTHGPFSLYFDYLLCSWTVLYVHWQSSIYRNLLFYS